MPESKEGKLARQAASATHEAMVEAFQIIDPIATALAPDAPENLMKVWGLLYDELTPDEIEKRRKGRGFTGAA